MFFESILFSIFKNIKLFYTFKNMIIFSTFWLSNVFSYLFYFIFGSGEQKIIF